MTIRLQYMRRVLAGLGHGKLDDGDYDEMGVIEQ